MARRNEPQTFIVPFAVRIEPNQRFKHPATDELVLSNFNGEGADLLFELDAFVKGLPDDSLVQRDNQHFGLPGEVRREGRILQWTMQAGESGKERDIILRQGEEPRKRERDGIEWTAYRVYVVIPKNAVTGWIFVEKEGVDSLPSEWRAELVRQFRARHPKFLLKVSQVRSASLWREVENAMNEDRVLSVEVATRAEGSSTMRPDMRGFPRDALATSTDLYVPPQGKASGEWLRRLRRAFTVSKDKNGIVEIDLADQQDDFAAGLDIELRKDVLEITARVLVDNGHRRKTIRFSGIREPFESYLVEGLHGQRVTQDRFALECKLHAMDLAREGGVTLKAGWDTGAWVTESLPPAMEVNARDVEADHPIAPVVELADVRPGA